MSKISRQKTQKRAKSFLSETSQILRHVQVDNRIYKRRLVFLGQLTSNVVGTINNALGMDPSGASDWGSCSALYDEFRVVGCKISIVSRTQNTVTLQGGIVFIIYDNDNSTAVASSAEAAEYQTVEVFPALWNNAHVYRFKYSRPSAGSETTLPWQDIGAPTLSAGAIKFFANSLSASTPYFDYMLEWAVEFRGIR